MRFEALTYWRRGAGRRARWELYGPIRGIDRVGSQAFDPMMFFTPDASTTTVIAVAGSY
jgi:hypothetical protein